MVKVKIVQADGEVKFYEYASVDQTIVALGKLAAPKAPRKPRNDAGQARGPHKPPTEPVVEPKVAPAAPVAPGDASTVDGADKPVASGTAASTGGAAQGTSTAAGAVATASSMPAPAQAASVTTLEQAQAAMEKVYKAKGVDTAKQILARLGTNRVKDILPASLGQFVKMATDIASFPEEQGTPAFGTKLQAYFAQSA
jgi:hypothetical protein